MKEQYIEWYTGLWWMPHLVQWRGTWLGRIWGVVASWQFAHYNDRCKLLYEFPRRVCQKHAVDILGKGSKAFVSRFDSTHQRDDFTFGELTCYHWGHPVRSVGTRHWCCIMVVMLLDLESKVLGFCPSHSTFVRQVVDMCIYYRVVALPAGHTAVILWDWEGRPGIALTKLYTDSIVYSHINSRKTNSPPLLCRNTYLYVSGIVCC